ncbi:hypothetical protein U1Q18_031385, partial [Sarracenia purpurea var. burkii]
MFSYDLGEQGFSPTLDRRSDDEADLVGVRGVANEVKVEGDPGDIHPPTEGQSVPLGKVAHDLSEQGFWPPLDHLSVAEAAQVGIRGDANETKGEGDILKDPVDNSPSSDLGEKRSSPPTVLEGEDSLLVEEVDEESSGEEESSEEDDSEVISVETCTEEGEKGISDAALLDQ